MPKERPIISEVPKKIIFLERRIDFISQKLSQRGYSERAASFAHEELECLRASVDLLKWYHDA
jgi:hypothetical protein